MNIKKFNQIIDTMQGLEDAFKAAGSVMSSGPSSFYFERMREYYEGCMKAAKYKVNETVELREDVDTNDAPGWEHCKHFLIKGAKAKVYEVDYYKGKYCYDIVFENESWINESGQKVLIENKHTFCFGENHLRKSK